MPTSQFTGPRHWSARLFFAWMTGLTILGGQQVLAASALATVSASTQADVIQFANAPAWFSPKAYDTQDVAWGDVDGDGDLDLVLANASDNFAENDPTTLPSLIFLNQNGSLPPSADQAIVLAKGKVRAATWADVDNDGDLDLALAFEGSTNLLYINNGPGTDGKPVMTPISLGDTDPSAALAWGDVNGDGFFDLAVGNICQPNKLYMNNGGTLQINSPISFGGNYATVSLDWADMDNDGDLDLAVGDTNDSLIVTDDCAGVADQGYPKIYRNTGGNLDATPFWEAPQPSTVTQVAWGRMDGDALPELAVSSNGGNSWVYRNIYAQNPAALFDITPLDLGVRQASDVQWGDGDGDGDLDLLLATTFDKLMIFDNANGLLSTIPSWLSPTSSFTAGIDWGDMDNDGDLDIAVANRFSASAVLLNLGSGMQESAALGSGELTGLAWGDMNNDGALDLAVAENCFDPTPQKTKVYRNQNGTLTPTAAWAAADTTCSRDVAWGDMNGDGRLDLAVATEGASRVYLNANGMLQSQPAWTSTDSDASFSLAWGDVDGDGDLDLAVGGVLNTPGAKHLRIYKNNNGMLARTATWASDRTEITWDVAWGDVDGDGDLDLAVANFGPTLLFLNENGALSAAPGRIWTSGDEDVSAGLAWGDVDGDGDPDLAVASSETQNKIYINDNGRLNPVAGWLSWDSNNSTDAAWADADGDGDMDLSTTNTDSQADRIYFNANGVLQTGTEGTWISPDLVSSGSQAWGDMDGDGQPELAVGFSDTRSAMPIRIYQAQTAASARPRVAIGLASDAVTVFSGQQATILAPADGYAVPGVRQSGIIPITYWLFDDDSTTFGHVRVFYSLDGGGKWIPAVATADTLTTNRASRPFPSKSAANTHVFKWDVAASGFFGQSDNVVVRIEAIPSPRGTVNSTPGPQLYGQIGSQSYPFRVRGTQVRVYAESVGAAKVVPGALVFQLPSGQGGAATAIGRGSTIFTTDGGGFLQGRGALSVGDKLVALAPITATAKYTVYQTSALPTLTGMIPFTMTATGVQNLVVSSQNPLILFNLSVSLEWDARKDTTYLTQLESDLGRASELLYDVTNGQAALGAITVYHDRANWEGADIRIHATNRLRPHATIGGSVTEVIQKNLPNGTNPAIQLAFFPGAVEMPASWNRFGESSGSLGEDWPRALAHEFGHYLFFLLEDYLGFDTAGLPVAISTCPSLMGNVYLDENSEFHPAASWANAAYGCLSTLQHQTLKRSDWETLVAFYPWLKAPTQTYANQLAGPSTLPLAVTKITTVNPDQAPTTLDVPSFYLVKPDGARYLASSSARAFRFHEGNLVDLGQPRQDRLQAWGARTGSDDRVCVFDMDAAAPAVGCQSVQSGITRLTVQSTPNWLPDIVVAPVTTNTLALTVTNITGGADLRARVYATDRPLTTTPPAEIRLAYDVAAKAYTATFPVHLAANLHLRDANIPAHELVTDFTLGGAPDLTLSQPITFTLPPGTVITHTTGITQTLTQTATLNLGTGALQLNNSQATVLGEGVVLNLGEGVTLNLGEGLTLSLGKGLTLNLGEGLTLNLGEGLALLVGQGNTLILGDGLTLNLGDGLTLNLGDGLTQILDDGNGPVLSSDGQVVLFVENSAFAPGQFYTLQPATRVPNPPSYATVVGQPYRLAASPGAPAILGSSISFRYLGRDVPPGEENFLKVWFFNESTGNWTPLPTTLDTVQNSAAATAQSAGLYVLMSSIEIPLRSAGWNLISYAVQGSRTVTDALSYLAARQTDWWVLGFEDTDPADPWRLYAPQPSTLNQLSTLTTLDFGRGYWIHVNQPITLYMRGAGSEGRQATASVVGPPATFYGRVLPTETLTPIAGMTVQTRVNGRVCGKGATRLVNGQIWYLVHVSADDGGGFAGCAGSASTIQFEVNGQAVGPAQGWQNGAIQRLELGGSGRQEIFLPLVRK